MSDSAPELEVLPQHDVSASITYANLFTKSN